MRKKLNHLHFKLNFHFSWYRNWHLHPRHQYVHFLVLFIYLFFISNLIYYNFISTTPAEASLAIFKLRVPIYRQEHRLSCEATSLRMALAGQKIYLTEGTLIKKLPFDWTPHRGNIWGDPYKAFVGNIDGISPITGYGVYWEPLARVARNYTYAKSFYGWSLSQLLSKVKKGNPVVVWGSASSYPGHLWWRTPQGKAIHAVYGEHARVVVGFTGSVDNPYQIILHDPLVSYPLYWTKTKFLENWNLFSRSGVVVYPKPPSLKVTSFSPPQSSFYQGEEATISFTLENYGAIDLSLDSVGVAVRYGNNRERNFTPQENVIIPANSSQTFTFKKPFYEVGNYRFWIYLYFKGNGYPWTSPRYFYVNSALTLTSFSFSPQVPVVDEEITINMTLKNNTPADVSLDSVGVAVRYGNNRERNFTPSENPIISASSNQNFTSKKSFNQEGLYTYWPYFYLQGVGTKLSSNRSFYLYPAISKVKVVSFYFSPSYPRKWQRTWGYFTLKNDLTYPLTLNSTGIAVRFSTYKLNFPYFNNISLNPGESRSFVSSRKFGYTGTYKTWVYFYFEGKGYVALWLSSNSPALRYLKVSY